MKLVISGTLPAILSLNGGYVDTAGYLALQGLFTAHVTGNFVTLGATLGAGHVRCLGQAPGAAGILHCRHFGSPARPSARGT